MPRSKKTNIIGADAVGEVRECRLLISRKYRELYRLRCIVAFSFFTRYQAETVQCLHALRQATAPFKFLLGLPASCEISLHFMRAQTSPPGVGNNKKKLHWRRKRAKMGS